MSLAVTTYQAKQPMCLQDINSWRDRQHVVATPDTALRALKVIIITDMTTEND